MPSYKSYFQPLGGPPEPAPDAFWIERAKAIQAYAMLEAQLAGLFGALLGSRPDKADIVFFKITSASARNGILAKLVAAEFAQKYDVFFKSFIKFLNKTDETRNHIVHWMGISQTTHSGQDEPVHSHHLSPRNGVFSALKITVADLIRFRTECVFLADLCEAFTVCCVGRRFPHELPDGFELDAWLKIFQQPVVHPPTSGHQLYQTPPGP